MSTEKKKQTRQRNYATIRDVLEGAGREDRGIFRNASSRVGTPLDPAIDEEDMLQAAALEAWMNREGIQNTDEGGNPFSMFYRLIQLRTIDMGRRTSMRRKKGDNGSFEKAESHDPLESDRIAHDHQPPHDFTTNLAAGEIIDVLRIALTQIKAPPLDIAILQGVLQEKSYEEIAADVNGKYTRRDKSDKPIDSEYIKSRLLQIRRRLAKNPMIKQLREDYGLPEKKKKNAE